MDKKERDEDKRMLYEDIETIMQLIKKNGGLLKARYVTGYFECSRDLNELSIFIPTRAKKETKIICNSIRELFDADDCSLVDIDSSEEQPQFWSVTWKLGEQEAVKGK